MATASAGAVPSAFPGAVLAQSARVSQDRSGESLPQRPKAKATQDPSKCNWLRRQGWIDRQPLGLPVYIHYSSRNSCHDS